MPAKILLRQKIMRRVLLALLPCIGGGVYFFGWRCLFLVLWAALVGVVVEFVFTRRRKEPVTEAVFVTTTIFALVMPPTVPLHVLTIGVVFAVMFGKELFGGFARNIFNPAMAGRCFVYICFPVALTSTWSAPADGSWGALNKWTTATGPHAVTGATPMAYLKQGRLVPKTDDTNDVLADAPFGIKQDQQFSVSRTALFRGLSFGRISGTMGVTSALLILIGGAYLFYTKTASRGTILSLIITYALLNLVLTVAGVPRFYGPLIPVLGGGFLFGVFFMATDPISSPRTAQARIIYGIIIAVFATVIRNFSIFNGGLMFSILLGNMFAPILDHAVKAYKAKLRAAKEPAT
jgi:Na+-transporting NADH:ubiquinone oxidoreductase subunit B